MFVLSNESGMMLFKNRFGSFVLTDKLCLADTWTTRKKAEQVLNTQISKNFRSRYKVVKVDDDVMKENLKVKFFEPAINEETLEQLYLEATQEILTYNLTNMSDSLKYFKNAIKDCDEKIKELRNVVSDIDKKISDIIHIIEWCELDEEKGSHIFFFLQHELKKRRIKKDELFIFEKIKECDIKEDMTFELKNLINTCVSRVYQPRILIDLFKEKGGR